MNRPRPADAGFATVWAAGAVAVLMGLLLIGIELGAAVAARHRAEAAADLAALAAAGHAVHGTAAACARAAGIAEQMDTRIHSCLLDGWEALVEVDADLRLAVLGPTRATGRARAGPVPAGPPALPAPAGPAPAAGGAPRRRPAGRRPAGRGGQAAGGHHRDVRARATRRRRAERRPTTGERRAVAFHGRSSPVHPIARPGGPSHDARRDGTADRRPLLVSDPGPGPT